MPTASLFPSSARWWCWSEMVSSSTLTALNSEWDALHAYLHASLSRLATYRYEGAFQAPTAEVDSPRMPVSHVSEDGLCRKLPKAAYCGLRHSSGSWFRIPLNYYLLHSPDFTNVKTIIHEVCSTLRRVNLTSTAACLIFAVSPPQLFLSQEEFNQPIFGANNISGQVLPVRYCYQWYVHCIMAITTIQVALGGALLHTILAEFTED